MSKYQKGEVITDFNNFLDQEFVYNRHKVLHKGWFLSWRLQFALTQLKQGNLFYAIKREDENVND
jgi:hypothetical protein